MRCFRGFKELSGVDGEHVIGLGVNKYAVRLLLAGFLGVATLCSGASSDVVASQE